MGWTAGEFLKTVDVWNEEYALTLRGTAGTTKNDLDSLLLKVLFLI